MENPPVNNKSKNLQLTIVPSFYLSDCWLYKITIRIVLPFTSFHIEHNAPCPPPPPAKRLHNHCFQFLLGITVAPRAIKDNGYAKSWGVNKVHYGLCENSELPESYWQPFISDAALNLKLPFSLLASFISWLIN